MQTAREATLADFVDVPEVAPLVHGERLGRYVVLETLGVGGMGHVFAAYDVVLERRVALKVLRRADPEERMRLIREARALAKLSHPNVVALYDVGELEGHVFLAMELVDGTTLRQWLRQPERTLEEILEAFTAAAEGLDAAHRVGIVHRDFKPDNVLVGRDGRVRVTDFGLAIRAEEAHTVPSGTNLDVAQDGRLTESGVVMGTPAYMPIEQHLGLPSDVRSDQFSFCVALYEALYGTRPFHGSNGRELCRAIECTDLRAPSSSRVPWQVHDVVLRGLCAKPEDRFSSMLALLEALRPAPARRRWGLLQGLAGVVLGAATMVVAQPTVQRVLPHVLETSVAARGVGTALEGMSQHAVQWRVAARRASTPADCEAAFEFDLGARVLCLDGLGGRSAAL